MSSSVAPGESPGQPVAPRAPGTHSWRSVAWVSLLATCLIWIAFTWPLVFHFTEGIPSSHHHHKLKQFREMIPGDHLQLLYHFWLAADMAAGRTPLFYNLYEFNAGDDERTYHPGSYYVPFSLVFAAARLIGGDAAGWNLTSFVSLWLTVLFTWLLLQRYTPHASVAAVASVVALMLPYRWVALLGGSPTGFGMMWVPLMLLGLDRILHEEKLSGGFLAGISILFARWGDIHVFFFLALLTPAWCLLSLIRRRDFAWRSPRAYLRLLPGLALFALFGLLAFVYTQLFAGRIEDSAAAGGRAWSELALFSPRPHGLFGVQILDFSNQVYLGYAMAALLLAALLVIPVQRHRQDFRNVLHFGLLFAGIVFVVILALGPHGPFEGKVMALMRRFVPPYRFIRQAAKIYCLLPTLLAVASAIGLTAILSFSRRGLTRALLLSVFTLFCFGEYELEVRPTLCRLRPQQAAYAAVAESAAAKNTVPRALVIPLWPGDSHYASVYQYYAMRYRIRLVNGYRPVVSDDYVENVFRRFESANQGVLDDGQIEELLSRGIDHLLLHEDLFPEKVSPFPVGVTLWRLLQHPRLELVRQDERVWAFRILASPRAPGQPPPLPAFLPARRFELGRISGASEIEEIDPGIGGTGYARLDASSPAISIRPTRVAAVDQLAFAVRARGEGVVIATALENDEAVATEWTVRDTMWNWFTAPVNMKSVFAPVSLSLQVTEGTVDLDMALLIGPTWIFLEPGESISLPAAAMFHAGYSDPATGAVRFRHDADPQSVVLYGPKLPLPRGRFRATLHLRSEAPDGTVLGEFDLRWRAGHREQVHSVIAPANQAVIEFVQMNKIPFNLGFAYAAEADLWIDRVVIERIE